MQSFPYIGQIAVMENGSTVTIEDVAPNDRDRVRVWHQGKALWVSASGLTPVDEAKNKGKH